MKLLEGAVDHGGSLGRARALFPQALQPFVDLSTGINPHNPDGRIVERHRLLALAARLRAKGGLLVVDEAFMDVGPREHSLAGDVESGAIVVLRSFGKFFGLAGLRLGFALSDVATVERLETQFGPWAESGPAVEHWIPALPDIDWPDAVPSSRAE